MKVKKYKGSEVRRLLTGMITNSSVAGSVAEKWEKEGLFDSRWANLIGGWCVRHYRKFEKAPGKQISTLFDSWAANGQHEDEVVEMVEKFLVGLSQDYSRRKKDVSAEVCIDLAQDHFNKVRMLRLSEYLKAELDRGRLDRAEEHLAKLSQKIEIGTGRGVDVFSDKEAVKRAFANVSKPVILYPGALGQFFGDALERDGFISLEGPEKRGKTWLLLDIAYTALKQGRRVAFFEVGDLSEAQIMRRFMIRASGRPLKPTEKDQPLKVPTMLGPPANEGEGVLPEILHTDKHFSKPLKWETAWEASQRVVKKYGDKRLMLETRPNSSISVGGINLVLDSWQRRGWEPDVVVIDYADILAPERGTAETRDQINGTWKALRQLSQKRHCLVVTATQTNAASYDAEVISKKHFSENKLKRAHVTGSVGINQTEEEKSLGIYRLNWIVGREWGYDERKCVYCAGCLGLAAPLMLSTF